MGFNLKTHATVRVAYITYARLVNIIEGEKVRVTLESLKQRAKRFTYETVHSTVALTKTNSRDISVAL